MWLFKKTKISIVAEGGERISIDHNQSTNLDLTIETHGVASVVINGNKEIRLLWWQRPVGILALTITAGVIVAGIGFALGWK